MDEEYKMWIIGWKCLTLVAFTLIVSLCLKFHMDNRIAFENGYERVQSFGSSADRWQKVK